MPDSTPPLANQACEACRPDSPSVPEADWRPLLGQLDDWEIVKEDGVPMLRRRIAVKNFVAALALATRIGDLAEAEDHHPRLVVLRSGLSPSHEAMFYISYLSAL